MPFIEHYVENVPLIEQDIKDATFTLMEIRIRK